MNAQRSTLALFGLILFNLNALAEPVTADVEGMAATEAPATPPPAVTEQEKAESPAPAPKPETTADGADATNGQPAAAETKAVTDSTSAMNTPYPETKGRTNQSREALLRSMEERRAAMRKRMEERHRRMEAEMAQARKEALQRQQELARKMEQRRREEEAWMRAMEPRIDTAIDNVGRPLPPPPGAGYGPYAPAWNGYPAYPPAYGYGYYPRW